MMRFFLWLMIVFIGIFSFPVSGQTMLEQHVSAENAILMESKTGEVLYEKKAHEQTEIASITKVMTALVALRYGDLDDEVNVSRKAAFTTGSSIYLELNEKMTLEDLLYGLMLRSGNDAAVAIAEHVGGSEEGFVYLMNETASYIGMTNTHFMNPHGLDDDAHYSTAYDMALLMKQAMNNKKFQIISGAESYQAESRSYPWKNKNKLLTSLYDATSGGKTGYTRSAGRTLITTAEKLKLSLIAVTLNAPDDWNDHIHLYEQAFDRFYVEATDQAGKKRFKVIDREEESTNNEATYRSVNDDVSQSFRYRFQRSILHILRIDNDG